MRIAYALIERILFVRGYWDEALRTGELAVKAARVEGAGE